MNIIKCEKGHFFDGDSYDKCPHCRNSSADIKNIGDEKAVPVREKRNFLFFGKKRMAKNSADGSMGDGDGCKCDESSGFVCAPTEILYGYTGADAVPTEIGTVCEEEISAESGKTAEFADISAEEIPATDFSNDGAAGNKSGFSPADSSGDTFDFADGDAGADGLCDENDCSQVPEDEGTGVSAAPHIQIAVSAEYFDPVVGWLVGIEGKNRGKSFCLYAGRNSAGNSNTFTCALAEGSINTGGALFYIIFTPAAEMFFLQPGTARDVCTLNGTPLLQSEHIGEGDVISTAGGKYMVIPLCGKFIGYAELVRNEER